MHVFLRVAHNFWVRGSGYKLELCHLGFVSKPKNFPYLCGDHKEIVIIICWLKFGVDWIRFGGVM